MYDFVDEKPKATHEESPNEAGDECVSEMDTETDLHPETRYTSDLSIDLHGKSHPDALYRAAGGEADDQLRGRYGCPCCGRTVGRVIRVRATKQAAWQAVCAMCAASTLDKHPDAIIGGLVRARRRRKRDHRLRDAG